MRGVGAAGRGAPVVAVVTLNAGDLRDGGCAGAKRGDIQGSNEGGWPGSPREIDLGERRSSGPG